MRKRKKICPACGMRKHLTIHHILPKRLFGEQPEKIKICADCHHTLEAKIQIMERKILIGFKEAYKALEFRFTHA